MVVLRQSACVTTFPASRTPATVASKIARIFIGSLIGKIAGQPAISVFGSLCPPAWDLLLCAKDLFVGAIRQPSRGFQTSQSRPHRVSRLVRTRFKTLIYLKGFGVGACGALVSTSKFFGADEQNPGRGQSD